MTTTTHNRSGVLRLAFGASIGASILAGALAPAASASTAPASLKAAIRYCESSGNYQAQNPSSTASGAYQFLDTTWHGLGYSGRAKNASAADQDAAFDKLYSMSGTSPWVSSQSCWGPKVASGNIPTTTSNKTTSTDTSKSAAVSRSASRSSVTMSAPSKAATSTPTKSAAVAATPNIAASDITSSSSSMLSDKAQAQIDAITKVQKSQSTWTPGAAAGQTVTRTTATISRDISTHAAPEFGPSRSKVKAGAPVTGHYVNIDWFKITSGPNAGQYINSGLLTKGKVNNGHLDAKSLAQVPAELRSSNAINTMANLSLVKSLIEMNAHYAADHNGANLKESDGYADFGQQASLFKRFGAKFVAPAGKSDHGLGLSMNFDSHSGDAMNTWLTKNAANHGFTAHDKFDSLFVFTG